MAEELHLHLLELARAKGEVARGDLVAEALSRLRGTGGDPDAHRLEQVLEVDEHPLGRLWAEKGRIFCAPQSAEGRLEHQIEFARFGELAFVVLARMLARLERALA